jgi:metal-responsive CopG/Arc/MetJ family transcriptional regulator
MYKYPKRIIQSNLASNKKNTNQENYVTLKIPKALADEIDLIIQSGTLGYRSRAEMVNDFIRHGIEQLRLNNSTKNKTLNKSGKE